MNFNEKLRQKIAEKGPDAAEKWAARYEENERKLRKETRKLSEYHAETTIHLDGEGGE
jgi:hypothetical protein